MMKETCLEKELRKAIADSGYSGYRLAKESDVPQGVLSRFINGKRTITLATASKLAEILGLELRLAKSSKVGIKRGLRSQKRGSLTGRGDSTNDQQKQGQSR